MIKKFKKLLKIMADARLLQALILHRVAAAVEHKSLFEVAGDFSLVVDVGANRGQFSLVAKSMCPSARVIAFEPIPKAKRVFERVMRGFDSVKVEELAVAESDSLQVLNLAQSDDSSSLFPIGRRQTTYFPDSRHVESLEVRAKRLDSLLKGVEVPSRSLLKLDVQGAELSCLKGAEGVLSQFSHVYAELSFVELYDGQPLAAEVIKWLGTNNFELQSVITLSQVRNVTLQADVLFQRKC